MQQTTIEASAWDQILRNHLILSKILRYLSPRDFFNCRRLNSFFKETIDYELSLGRKENDVAIRIPHNRLFLHHQDDMEKAWECGLQDLHGMIEKLRFLHLRLMLNNSTTPPQVIDKLVQLLRKFGEKIKTLGVSGPDSSSHKHLFTRIYPSLVCIEEVSFDDDALSHILQEHWPKSPGLESVQHLKLLVPEEIFPETPEANGFLNFLKLFPSLKSFSGELPTGRQLLKNLVDGELELKNFQDLHLNSFQSRGSYLRLCFELEVEPGIDGHTLRHLALIPNHLNRLVLSNCLYFHDEKIHQLNLVLGRHGPTLETLDISPFACYANTTELLKMPQFHKLQVLRLKAKFHVDGALVLAPPKLERPILYEDNFPVLKELYIEIECSGSSESKAVEEFIQIFVPVDTRSTSVRNVTLSLSKHLPLDRANLNYRLCQVFPNAKL